MSAKSTSNLSITFEAPCVGRLDELLATTLGGTTDPRLATTTRTHLAKCPRCRDFVASQARLRPAVNRAFERLERAKVRGSIDSPRDLESWLDGALARNDAQEVARAACRIANAVLATDQDFAATTFVDDNAPGDPANPLSALDVLVPRLLERLDRPRWGSKPQAAARRGDALRDAMRRLDQEVRRSSPGERISCARRIVKLANEIASERSSSVHVVRSHLEWCWGDADKVPADLELALATARTPGERTKALCNASVWHFGAGAVDKAFRFSRSALDLEPTKQSTLLNLFRWTSVVADADACGWLDRLGATKSGRSIVLSETRARHEAVMKSVALHAGVDHRVADRRRKRALDQLDALRCRIEQEAPLRGES